MASLKEEDTDKVMLQIDVDHLPVPTLLSRVQCPEGEEPHSKKQKVDDGNNGLLVDNNVKATLLNINKAICVRLDCMEHKLSNLTHTCNKMGHKLDGLQVSVARALAKLKEFDKPTDLNGDISPNTVVIGLPPEEQQPVSPDPQQSPTSHNISRNVTLITLNTEEDFPNGSWLGDESNVESRVRCNIPPADMLHVMQNSKTSEKCALKLLDYLFDRETQAASNLSGTGKHGKKQLDPLIIYGLRCHLIRHFNISDNEWQRIRINIDSKCRTAFRRKQRGLPLTVKAFGFKSAMPIGTDQMFAPRFEQRMNDMNDSMEEVSADQCDDERVIKMEHLPVEDHITEISTQEEDIDQHEQVQIDRDRIQLHKGQINITQTGEIQLALLDELAGGATLVIQPQEHSRRHHDERTEECTDDVE